MKAQYVFSSLLTGIGLHLAAMMGFATQAPGLPGPGVVATLSRPPTIGPVKLGDPVVLRLTVANPSHQAVSLLQPRLERFSFTTMSFLIMPPRAKDYVEVEAPILHSGAHKIVPAPKAVPVTTIAPGKEESFEFILHYDFPTLEKRRWLFPEPGEYLVKARLRFLQTLQEVALIHIEDGLAPPTDVVETGSVVVRVEALEREADSGAWAELGRLPHEFLLFAPDNFEPCLHPGAEAAGREYLREHRASRYAAAAELFLAYASLKRGVEMADETAIQEAIVIGERLLLEDLHVAMRPHVFTLLSKARQIQQRFPEAKP